MLKQNDITMIEMERSAVQRDAESQGLSAEKYRSMRVAISSVSPVQQLQDEKACVHRRQR